MLYTEEIMGDSGKKDKGKKEERKKPKLTIKEKRKLKNEKEKRRTKQRAPGRMATRRIKLSLPRLSAMSGLCGPAGFYGKSFFPFFFSSVSNRRECASEPLNHPVFQPFHPLVTRTEPRRNGQGVQQGAALLLNVRPDDGQCLLLGFGDLLL